MRSLTSAQYIQRDDKGSIYASMCGMIAMIQEPISLADWGGNLLKKVAIITKLNKRDFHPADKDGYCLHS